MTQSELVAFVPPLTTFHVTPNHQVITSLDNRFLSMQHFTMPMVTRKQPFGMSTSMMEGLQTNASTYADNATVFTPYKFTYDDN
jgi:hypothetical protein